jgi:two-component system, response regulator YesN
MIKRALIVDDDEIFCAHLAEAFEGCVNNCTCVTARNGAEAAKVMANIRFDVVITDLNMPAMSGYEFIKHTKEHYPDMPILAMTGTKTPEVLARLHAIGVQQCIEKPFNVKDMVPTIFHELREKISDVLTTSE